MSRMHPRKFATPGNSYAEAETGPKAPPPAKKSQTSCVMYFDGSSIGNGSKTSRAGCGAHGSDANGRVTRIGVPLPVGTTSNEAEYEGAIAALKWALRHGYTNVPLRGDSMLVVKQALGEWKINKAALREKCDRLRKLAARIGHVDFQHIPRTENALADSLARVASGSASGPRPSSAPAAASARHRRR